MAFTRRLLQGLVAVRFTERLCAKSLTDGAEDRSRPQMTRPTSLPRLAPQPIRS